MTRPQLVINIRGGVVQDVFCSVPGPQAIVVDWDVGDSVPGKPGIVDVPVHEAHCAAYVQHLAVRELRELAGTDAEAAIDAACEQGLLADREGAFCY
jgi:hypothetical protein